MDRLAWGKLSTEIIELISQFLLDERERSVEWRILNKHWFDATSRSFYRKGVNSCWNRFRLVETIGRRVGSEKVEFVLLCFEEFSIKHWSICESVLLQL